MRTQFAQEILRARQRVAAAPSTTIPTKWGPIQYLDQGSGPPVFISHGVLGGHDNVRHLVDLWFGSHYRAIAPSRFGYLGSAMPARATVADQADAYAALLDHLGVDRVVMCGFSAGGPAAIQFALRHPERLHALVLGSAYLPGMGARVIPGFLHPVLRAIAGWERGWWLLKTYRPNLLAQIMGCPKGWDTAGDTDFLAIREALFPVHDKRYGIVFDAAVSEPASNDFPLEHIRVPTLLVHAADDRLAPYECAAPAASRIPGAQLVTIEAGGHLFLDHAAQVRAATSAAVDQHAGEPPPTRHCVEASSA